ncbi:MAG: D-2-hydroxyacid dehydrogenase [Rhodospirillaceae bacterium]|nr:D-2-hydroxyacid dehydrogenase [Rhodospirillaceae bacterium]MBT4686672.1 D-2-hydroxyacid dehydrogenase [Rhodospirillaceae bacterium]MBT5082258.1 D-2-hydroxyacid dehydrogenase [Rhodospirillaceae bacterium]MBT5526777.1 D-2-hydroxyacid dehydrogenase [Rhodospirillaceae bacterium]MBT5879142.1 D-2-hydroxyacid dehydrogenase [Rhodospirillaceae bacterium]
MSALFEQRETGIKHFQSWNPEDLRARMGDGDVLVLSGYWKNDMLATADKLRFIQVCAAGFDQFDQDAIRAQGVRLANASGVNVNAVSDHAMALLLSLTRQLHTGRDNQRQAYWRPMISDLAQREDELPGKTILIFGLGKIGARLAKLAKAFDMTVIGLKRDTSQSVEHVDELYPSEALMDLLPRADCTALTCPLTPQTQNIIDGPALTAMKPSSFLINVARGGCVDEPSLIEALRNNVIAGAGIDVTVEEPLADDSPLWSLENAMVTPHTGGETRKYEDNVIDILMTNLDRLSKGEGPLHNQII